jgi:hypothetical protein
MEFQSRNKLDAQNILFRNFYGEQSIIVFPLEKNLLIDVQFAEGSFDSEHFLRGFGSSGSFLFLGFHLLAFHKPFTSTFHLLLPVGFIF